MNKKVISILAVLLLVFAQVLPVYAENQAETELADTKEESDKERETEQKEVIYITSVADLCALSKSCRLDTWSQNKCICLTTDLNLSEVDFTPIPTFGGFFDGAGHSIEGLRLTDPVSYLGFFSYLQECGTISDLHVKGIVTPSGKQSVVGGLVGDNRGTIQNCTFEGTVSGNDYTGGVVGFNEASGFITQCSVKGNVIGMHFTGGVTGENMGEISQCINEAKVNISNIDRDMSLDDINAAQITAQIFDFNGEDNKKDTANTMNSSVDTGGIAGFSCGTIYRCINRADIGYEHVGYNVGGIAGRQSGYISACSNYNTVLGRKDIGGIIGQAEPYLTVDLSKDIVYQLTENINKLHDLVDKTLMDAGTESDTVSARLTVLQDFTNKALQDTGYLADKTVEWTDDVVGATNEAMGRVDYVMDEAGKEGGMLDQTSQAVTNIKDATDSLENALDSLDIYRYMSDEETIRYDADKAALNEATNRYNEYYNTATKAYRYWYMDQIRTNEATYNSGAVNENDLYPMIAGVIQGNWSVGSSYNDYLQVENWVHYDVGSGNENSFPSEEEQQGTLDQQLLADTQAQMADNSDIVHTNATLYADSQYPTYTVEVQGYVDDISDIVTAHSGEMTEDAVKEAKDAIASAKSAASQLENATNDARGIVSNLNQRADITVPQLGNEYRLHTNSLVGNLQGMSDNLGFLNKEMSDGNDTLIQDMQAVNDQFSVIMLLFMDAVDGALDMDYSTVYEDNSNEVAYDCIDGTVADCVNSGEVKGDINIGGISGTMAIEYDFDLESDVTGIKEVKANSTYNTKCILRKNVNSGYVEAQKNYAGGSVGAQELGIVLMGENYGKTESNTGDYVGGIAGQSYAIITKCYVKAILGGRRYVGGVAGSGNDISECYSMVRISKAESFSGAIAGKVDEEAEVRNNFFVSDELAGIDRISYSTNAEPITYSQLLAIKGIPAEFYNLMITFWTDGKVFSTVKRRYGDSLNADYYPKIPEKEGYYAVWSQPRIEKVTFDEEITGEYNRFVTTIASDIKRDNDQSVFLVDGDFRKEDELKVSEITSDVTLPKGTVECYKIVIPKDGGDTHQVRFQAPTKKINGVELYLKGEEGWSPVPLSTMGRYLTFEVNSNTVQIAVLQKSSTAYRYLWILVLIPVGVGVYFIDKRRKHIRQQHH